MAHFRVFCTALRITRIKNDLIKEKTDSLTLYQGGQVHLTHKQRCRHSCLDFRLFLQRCFTINQNKCFGRFIFKLKHDGSLENYLLKSIFGFFSGFLITYTMFMFFVMQLNFRLSTATLACSLFGAVLMLGLAFSQHVRCIVLLTLPQLFSKRGRQALLAYAFILAMTGPAKNTLNNMGILNESLACGQEQLKDAVRQIVEVIKKPFVAIREAIKSVVRTVKEIIKKIKEIFLKIKRIIMAILRVIKAAFSFLGRIFNICNKELGTPFERCTRVFDNAINDCNAKLGPLFNWLCSIAYLIKAVCYVVKIFDFICMLVDFISDSVIGVVIRKVKSFIRHVRTMFYVRIKFSHSFHFKTNSSKSYSQVAARIVGEVKDRTRTLAAFFDLVSFFTSFLFVFLIVKVLHYRFRFLTSERFDNKYISRNFREIDLQRAKIGRETILPLKPREIKVYTPINSCRLVKKEKKKLAKSLTVLFGATLKMGCFMLLDFSLFWVLNMIRYHARFQSKVKAPNLPTVKVEGKGLLADLLQGIIKAFQPMGIELQIDTIPCLPNPIPPDYDRYLQIGTLLILCWLLTILEPYGLRFRSWIMGYYHPVRAKQRAVWLYNHILRSRLSFLKLARRQLRRTVLGRKDLSRITCKEFLRAKLSCRICRLCLGEDKQESCLMCGEVFRESDEVKIIKCATPNCPGMFCQRCFDDLKNLCTVCLSPIEYGDMSDISEEKGSEEEEEIVIKKNVRKSHTSARDAEEGRLLQNSGNESDSSQHSYQYEKKEGGSDVELLKRRREEEEEEMAVVEYASMESFRQVNEESSEDEEKARVLPSKK